VKWAEGASRKGFRINIRRLASHLDRLGHARKQDIRNAAVVENSRYMSILNE